MFSLTNTPGSPQSVVAVSGTPQAAILGRAFTNALQAKVTDALANPISGATVTFTAPSSGASARFGGSNSTTATTNALGIAISPIPVANNTAGSYNVAAAMAGITAAATFSLTNTAGNIVAVSGTPRVQPPVQHLLTASGQSYRRLFESSIWCVGDVCRADQWRYCHIQRLEFGDCQQQRCWHRHLFCASCQ